MFCQELSLQSPDGDVVYPRAKSGLLLHSFLCSVPEQSHGINLAEEGPGRWAQLSSVGEHGKTVGDMNKSHKTDPPPQVEIALSGEHKNILENRK